MTDPFSNIPPAFKPIQHYLKTAFEHDKRDPAVSYYCRLYAMQKGMEIDRKSPESRAFLAALMQALEQAKTVHKDNEAMQNEVVGQAHVENYALKLFLHADTDDRAGRFGKNVVKLFYTAGMLMDVLATFGEITEEVEKNRKYAKWKAAYIHNCLKNGETPHPGPLDEEGEGEGPPAGAMNNISLNPHEGGFAEPPHGGGTQGGYGGPQGGYGTPQGGHGAPQGGYGAPTTHPGPGGPPMPAARSQPPAPVTSPTRTPHVAPSAPSGGGAHLKPEDYTKAMKFCRYASSALQYEDAKTAIDNLTKALNLLTTGHE